MLKSINKNCKQPVVLKKNDRTQTKEIIVPQLLEECQIKKVLALSFHTH